MEPKPSKAKENSYYYWCDEKNKSNCKNPKNLNAPKKITNSDILKSSQGPINKIQSQWNTLGTWEEKTFKVEEFIQFIKENTGEN